MGKVIGIDHIPELVEWSVTNLKKDGLGQALENKQIEMVVGDGRQGKSGANRILCSSPDCAPQVIPAAVRSSTAEGYANINPLKDLTMLSMSERLRQLYPPPL